MMNNIARLVRNHYKAQDHEVRISRDGHVTYRPEGRSMWLEGRWVEEYRIGADGNMWLV